MLKSKIHHLENSKENLHIKNFIMLKTYLLMIIKNIISNITKVFTKEINLLRILVSVTKYQYHSSYDDQLAISLLDKQK